MSIIRNIVLYDSDGHEIDTHLDADGGYHLGVAMSQAVYADANEYLVSTLEAIRLVSPRGLSLSDCIPC